MTDKTNEEIYRAYLLAYACGGDASRAAVLQDVRPADSVVAAALALAERDRLSNEPPDTWESLAQRLQAMFDGFDPNGCDLSGDAGDSQEDDEDEDYDDEDEDEEEVAEQ
jgi:hypothetical protein